MVGFEHAPFLGTVNGYTGMLKWQSANTGPAGRLIAGAQIGAQIGTKIHGIFLPHANPKKKESPPPHWLWGLLLLFSLLIHGIIMSTQPKKLNQQVSVPRGPKL